MRLITLLATGLAASVASAAGAGPFEQTGAASWYGGGHHGRKTASGEVFDMHKLTAAHPKLPLGSVVEVTNLANDRTVQVRVNDRGPHKGSRILDVSRAAADQLGFLSAGTAQIRIRLLDGDEGPELRPKLPADIVAPLVVAAPEATGTSTPAYFVRVGAFSVRANAERAASKLNGIGPVKVEENWRTGRVLHLVSVGSWTERAKAEAARGEVAGAGFADARVVGDGI